MRRLSTLTLRPSLKNNLPRAATPFESRKYPSHNLALDVSCLTGINRRFLSYLILPKPATPAPANSGTASGHLASNGGEKEREKEREHSSSRISGAISNSITSIGDVFRDVTARDGSKSVKFPEKLLKVLENRLENIAMGKDNVYVCLPTLPFPYLHRFSLLIHSVSKKLFGPAPSKNNGRLLWPV